MSLSALESGYPAKNAPIWKRRALLSREPLMTSKPSAARGDWRIFASLCLLTSLIRSSCSVGPKYRRPDVTVPNVYRGLDPAAGPQTSNSLGDEKWWTVFHDNQLQDLIRTALSQNYDVRIGATRVLEAEASLGITRADQFPTVAAGVSATSERVAQTAISPEFETSPTQLGLSFAWELDFWGKFRNATKAARATLLATEWGQKAVLSTIVSEVAQAYFELLELDSELEISKTTLDTRKDSLRLVNIRESAGAMSMMDVYQSEQLVYGAAAALPDLERRIQQQENFISVLLGKNPGPISRGAPLAAFTIAPTVPAKMRPTFRPCATPAV